MNHSLKKSPRYFLQLLLCLSVTSTLVWDGYAQSLYPELTGDDIVDASDLLFLFRHSGTVKGDQDFRFECDLDGDGVIGNQDHFILSRHWKAETSGPPPITVAEIRAALGIGSETPRRWEFQCVEGDKTICARRYHGPDHLSTSRIQTRPYRNPTDLGS